jgi:hypothetical protein
MGNSSSSLALIAALRTIGEPDDSAQRRASSLLDDHELWRGLFTSSFTIIDLETVMSSQYLRTLRIYHPDRLAAILFKCISQLHAFAFEFGEDAASIAAAKESGGGGGATSHQKSNKKKRSPQSVLNALMILQHTMPIVFEDADVALMLLQGVGNGNYPQQTVSYFSADFLAHVFLHNRTCAAAVAATSAASETAFDSGVFPHLSFPTLSTLLPLSTASSSTPSLEHHCNTTTVVPLGTLLVECLVRLCFVPDFTIPTPNIDATKSAFVDRHDAKVSFDVVPEILWCRGIVGRRGAGELPEDLPKWGPSAHLMHHLSDAFFSSMSDYRRQVLLTLNIVLTLPLYRQRCVEDEPVFLAPLTRQVTLFPTLVASLVNNLVLYDPRGRLPYTSHMITTSEHVVVLGVQLLNISLDYSGLLLGPVGAPEQPTTSAPSPTADNTAVNDDRVTTHPPRSRLTAPRSSSQPRDDEKKDDADDGGLMGAPDVDSTEATTTATVDMSAASSTPHCEAGEQKNIEGNKLFVHQSTLSASARALQKSIAPAEHRTSLELAAEAALCRNTGWALLCQRVTPNEAQWIVSGLALLFGNVTRAKSTFLPQSQRTIFEHDLLLVLLWKLIDRSLPIRCAFGGGGGTAAVAGTTGATTAYVIPLCYYLTSGRRADNQSRTATAAATKEGTSLSQIAMFILLKLSAERNFVLACNDTFTEHLPFALPDVASPNGTYNDVILLACLSVVQDAEVNAFKVDGNSGERRVVPKHRPMHASCITVIANIAPFMQSVSLGTTLKLIRMLELFGRPSFLLESPVEHGKWLMLVIESLCSLLQYQFRGCGHLAYGLVRSRDVVYSVLDLFENDDEEAARLHTQQQRQQGEKYDGSHRSEEESIDDGAQVLALAPPTPPPQPPKLSVSEFSHASDPSRDAVIEHRKSLLFTLRCALGALEIIALPLVQSTRIGVSDIPLMISQRSTLVGALPVPHSIVVRAFPSSYSVDEWVSKALWGYIFSHAVPGALVRSTKSVKLFTFS